MPGQDLTRVRLRVMRVCLAPHSLPRPPPPHSPAITTTPPPQVTIPPFFLEARSLLERMADTQMHPDLLLGVSALPTPLARITAITKWWLSGWHYKTVGVKKPFNPIIGETFACYWSHPDGTRTQYFAEQVEHRPPISAIYFENSAHHVKAHAHIWTKSQFSAPQTTKSILEGSCVLTLTNLGGPAGETYWITFPTYYAHNLVMGTMRMEMGDMAHVACEATGLRADIEFHQKGMFSAATVLNSLSGKIVRVTGQPKGKAGPLHPSAPSETLYTFAGHWDGEVRLTPAGAKDDGGGAAWLDVRQEPVSPKRVLPLPLQGPWESRALWVHCAAALSARPTVDWAAVDLEKAQLEEEQRLLPCHLYKTGAPGWADFGTKAFAKAPLTDPIKGGESEMYVYSSPPGGKAGPGGETNLLALSRSLPDPRGGLHDKGACGGEEGGGGGCRA